MPQMSPLNWLNLFLFFTMTMFMLMWLIFFKNNKINFKKIKSHQQMNMNLNNWNNKWY